MLKDFKKFALRGNVLDMAVGVIIGGAFGKVVTSLVNDIIMPALTVITGKIKFEDLFIVLDGEKYNTLAEAKEAGASTLNYGAFITSVIDFLIIAISIFFVIRQIGKIKEKVGKKREEPAPTVKDCPFCKTSIHIDASRCPNCTSQLGEPNEDSDCVGDKNEEP